jgi:hypothetical protein
LNVGGIALTVIVAPAASTLRVDPNGPRYLTARIFGLCDTRPNSTNTRVCRVTITPTGRISLRYAQIHAGIGSGRSLDQDHTL